MLPPPAPIVWMSIARMRRGWRATESSDLNKGRPASTAIFAPFRIDFARQRNVQAGRDAANNLGRGALVSRIDKGEQENDGDGLAAARDQIANAALDVATIKRHHDIAAEIESLAHLYNAI